MPFSADGDVLKYCSKQNQGLKTKSKSKMYLDGRIRKIRSLKFRYSHKDVVKQASLLALHFTLTAQLWGVTSFTHPSKGNHPTLFLPSLSCMETVQQLPGIFRMT